MPVTSLSDKTLQAIVEWASAHQAVRAVLLTSTHATLTGKVDALSDYDVILVVENIHPFVEDHSWLNVFGDVLVVYWDPVYPDPQFAIEICANVVQYRSGLKIDFTLWSFSLLKHIVETQSLPTELDAGYRLLLDKDRMANALPEPTGKAYIPGRPTLSAYQHLVNDLLSDAPYVAKCLWRGELLPAKWCLDHDMKHVYLLPMLEWYAEIGCDWSKPVGYLGKGLKELLPADIWSELEGTDVGARMDENWEALYRTLGLFRKVARQVGAHFGYDYLEDLHQGVLDYLQRIKHMNE